MGKEIERKFLVDKQKWAQFNKPVGQHYRQAYLINEIEKTVRVRLTPDTGFLTIKSSTDYISRAEYEYEIPVSDAKEILDRFCKNEISKNRYKPIIGGKRWDVDEFLGDNEGLMVAEIELEFESQEFEKPDWVGEEVSGDERYYNAFLIDHPYKTWKND